MIEQVPLVTLNVVGHIDFFLVSVELKVEFEAIICPGSELHRTSLDVEREVSDVDSASTFEDGHWNPQHQSRIRDYRQSLSLFVQSGVRTEIRSQSK